jgi:hypothetical protein
MYLASSAGSHIDKLPASGPVEFDDMNHSRRHEGLCSGCSTDLDLARLVRRHRQPHSIPPSSKGRTSATTGDRRLLPVSSRSAHTSSGQDQELASVIDDKDRLSDGHHPSHTESGISFISISTYCCPPSFESLHLP